jgi:hypothetical protein
MVSKQADFLISQLMAEGKCPEAISEINAKL